jgi:hypothetical protein
LFDTGRQLHGFALDAKLDGKTGVSCLLDQLVDVLDARLRRERRRLVETPEHSDHSAHLCERFPTCLLDHLECLALANELRLEQHPHTRRLHRHHTDSVADDVVQLPGDPGALLGDGEASAVFPLTLGSLGALSRLSRLRQLAAEREPDRPDDADDDAHEHEVADAP